MSMFRCAECGALNRVPSGKSSPFCGRCKKAIDVSGKPQEVGPQELLSAVGSAEVPVLVDFWAPWCGPCRMVAPAVEAVAKGRAGSLLALKLNTEQHPEASERYGIRGIPTFLLFNKGSEVARKSGAMPQSMLEAWLSSASG